MKTARFDRDDRVMSSTKMSEIAGRVAKDASTFLVYAKNVSCLTGSNVHCG